MSWHIETNSMGAVVLICNDKGHPVARMVDDKDYANAALIAAAPDLLAALKSLLAIPEYDGTQQTSANRRGAKHEARAAIRKATTETN